VDILLVPKVVAGAFKERRPPFLQSDGLLEVILVWQQASMRHSAAVLRSCPEVRFADITTDLPEPPVSGPHLIYAVDRLSINCSIEVCLHVDRTMHPAAPLCGHRNRPVRTVGALEELYPPDTHRSVLENYNLRKGDS
jgi:hypothetical protein